MEAGEKILENELTESMASVRPRVEHEEVRRVPEAILELRDVSFSYEMRVGSSGFWRA